MKKFLKILAIAAIAVAAAIACAFAGCNNDDDSTEPVADYNFTLVYEDGSPVNGQTDGNIQGKVMTQICLPGEGAACISLSFQNIFPDANGKLSLSQSQVNTFFGDPSTDVTVFVFHSKYVTGHKEDCEVAVNGKGDYTLIVTVS